MSLFIGLILSCILWLVWVTILTIILWSQISDNTNFNSFHNHVEIYNIWKNDSLTICIEIFVIILPILIKFSLHKSLKLISINFVVTHGIFKHYSKILIFNLNHSLFIIVIVFWEIYSLRHIYKSNKVSSTSLAAYSSANAGCNHA